VARTQRKGRQQRQWRAWLTKVSTGFGDHFIKLLVPVCVAFLLGVFTTKTVDDDATSKGIYAEIGRVISQDGRPGVPRNVVIAGTASTSLASGFEMRHAIRGISFWYPSKRPLAVVDNRWRVRDALGDDDEVNGEFTLKVLFGRAVDFEAWANSKMPTDDGLAKPPDAFGIYTLADRVVQRTR
jgi:hypothetical protein